MSAGKKLHAFCAGPGNLTEAELMRNGPMYFMTENNQRRGRGKRKGRERRRKDGEGEKFHIKVDQELGVCLKIF